MRLRSSRASTVRSREKPRDPSHSTSGKVLLKGGRINAYERVEAAAKVIEKVAGKLSDRWKENEAS